MSAVFYLQSSSEEIRWCPSFELYWFCCQLLQMVCCLLGSPRSSVPLRPELLRRRHAAGLLGAGRRAAALQPHLLDTDLVCDHLLDAVGEVDEALGAGVAHDALHVGVHLVDVLPGLGAPLLLVG